MTLSNQIKLFDKYQNSTDFTEQLIWDEIYHNFENVIIDRLFRVETHKSLNTFKQMIKLYTTQNNIQLYDVMFNTDKFMLFYNKSQGDS